ncbi:ABC transporter ATP-binding protein [Lentibacillus amyloliquefaciens]|uniref:Spermidine/putrescine ABC transporter ATP-binding protein n=1 Tax=Lentibacillus amyloliquefaciens TaxID=1472767 RepID=A0A0U4FL43_9BACI|nr:ABC transporter ATP-binding protein [Lentibacillus amyloliquefaciens]ALX48436.1 spermidine/putrescine ABC transporter ATP-binding protein [Lentibacillus amyloliquefaciens]
MSFLTLDHVSHHYFSKKTYTKALENISFSVKDGEFVALLGPSGCGKSTILSIIAGIIEHTAGNIYVGDQPLHKSELDIGYMLQQDYLFPWKSILDNVLIGPKINRDHSSETKERAADLLRQVGLPNMEESYPDSLSGGMRQRVALVRTLITNPNILLLDEPFSALDYQTKLKLENLVWDLLHMYKKTSVLVTHDIGEAIAMSDRLILMNANPGSIAKTFEVPIELRNEEPFLARRHPKYQLLFDKVWEELEKSETDDSADKGGGILQ